MARNDQISSYHVMVERSTQNAEFLEDSATILLKRRCFLCDMHRGVDTNPSYPRSRSISVSVIRATKNNFQLAPGHEKQGSSSPIKQAAAGDKDIDSCL